jgi:peptidyl-prolyl cis-trans isomerase D
MLDSIRKRKDNLIFSGLVVLTAIVMGFFGISSFENSKDGGVAAWVNGEPITNRDFRNEVEFRMSRYRQMLGENDDPKLLESLRIPERTLEEMVKSKLLLQQARRLGVTVTDRELADVIRSEPSLQRDGKFDPERYRNWRERTAYERQRREELEIMRFQRYLLERLQLSPWTTAALAQARELKVDLDVARIDFRALSDRQPITDAAVDAYLKTASEAVLKQKYEAQRAEYTQKPRTELRQIRVGIPFEASDDVKKAAKNKIEAIAKEVNAGNFDKIARERSDDEYAASGGLVGWVTQGTLEPPLEAAVAKLAPGEVSAPIETTFGWYIVQVLRKEPETVKPFNQVKRDVARSALKEERRKEYAEKKRTEWNALLAKGTPLDAILKAEKVDVKSTGSFSPSQGFIPQVGAADPVLDAVFQLSEKQPLVKALVPYQDYFYYVRLKKVERPKGTKPEPGAEQSILSSVQAEFFERWIGELQKTATIKSSLPVKAAADAGFGG